jgi:hypothetical protein
MTGNSDEPEADCEEFFREIDRRIENASDENYALRMAVYRRALRMTLKRVGAEQFAENIQTTLREMGLR